MGSHIYLDTVQTGSLGNICRDVSVKLLKWPYAFLRELATSFWFCLMFRKLFIL